MEKERGARIIAIIALVVAIVGLSVGFASYTARLQITDTSATVGAGSASDFSVEFSTAEDEITDNTKSIDTIIGSASTTGGAAAVKALDASMSGTTISGLSATFTAPGSVTYTVYAHNTGKFLAYLRAVTIGEKECIAIDNTSQDLVNDVCPSLSMTVKVGNEAATAESVDNYSGHSLAKGYSEPIIITLTYSESDSAADGDFTVNFGQIDLDYNYVDGTASAS